MKSDMYRLAESERSEMGWPLCVYCGDPADSTDHFPPLKRLEEYQALMLKKPDFLIVKACSECRELAGGELHKDFDSRYESVKFKLKKMLKSTGSTDLWDAEELLELGPNLRSQVAKNRTATEHLLRRIDYAKGKRRADPESLFR